MNLLDAVMDDPSGSMRMRAENIRKYAHSVKEYAEAVGDTAVFEAAEALLAHIRSLPADGAGLGEVWSEAEALEAMVRTASREYDAQFDRIFLES